ncbi:MAG: hypothetical protein P4L51_05420 [Puia sp.]|nr:hypothetical protein [Puia sp.]
MALKENTPKTEHTPNARRYYWIIGVVVILIPLGLWAQYRAHFKWKDVADKGVFTVAKVTGFETTGYDSKISLEVYLGDKKYTTIVNEDCDECVGSYFFVKVLKDDPLKYPLVYGEEPVPDCIVTGVKNFEGWQDFPKCDPSTESNPSKERDPSKERK